ncbi:helix-turn-helix domain-containing protein [Streptomyces sp. NBC_01451]|uniref:helix-turn-helix domain-containing protein n=1 Tax=Streptomyces sp. NBC_01451 TaxID=2903872 RepID=UPI002E3350C3|nr:helix-turn-helix transcriptional regulator [Streptomyces sp. NBC_01451]
MASRFTEPTARQVRLGHALEALRLERLPAEDRSLRKVAGVLGWDPSKLSRIETGRLGISEVDLERLFTLYGVKDKGPDGTVRLKIIELKRKGNERGWETQVRDVVNVEYADYIAYEGDAESMYSAQPMLVPGLLQTHDYASAVLGEHLTDIPTEEREERLAIRARRQEVFERPNPPMFWGVISESVLRHVIGSPEIMADQLDRLLERCANNPHNTNIQVLREESSTHASLFGPFVILSFPERWEPDIVYVEGYTENRFLEDAKRVKWHSDLFRRLMKEALTGPESVQMIGRYADRYRKG